LTVRCGGERVSNTVVLIGNIASEPKRNDFQRADGEVKTKVRFLLAVNRWGRGRDGAQAQPDWIPVEVWGTTARALVEWNRKGSRLGVTGRIRSEFDKPDGAEKGTLQIAVVAERVEFLTPKSREAKAGAGEATPPAPSEAGSGSGSRAATGGRR
jgi:single-strand DNA-binding protein